MIERQYYSMLIESPKSVADEINKRLAVVDKRVDLPHLTLGRPFHSTQKNIELSLEKNLRLRDPFKIYLDKIDRFYDRVLFLTSRNDLDIDRIEDLFFEIKPTIDGGLEERIKFVPHLTLTKKELDEADQELLKNVFMDPICMPVDRVSLFRANKGRWKKLGDFGLGKTS